jgi:hypothetical protein
LHSAAKRRAGKSIIAVATGPPPRRLWIFAFAGSRDEGAQRGKRHALARFLAFALVSNDNCG